MRDNRLQKIFADKPLTLANNYLVQLHIAFPYIFNEGMEKIITQPSLKDKVIKLYITASGNEDTRDEAFLKLEMLSDLGQYEPSEEIGKELTKWRDTTLNLPSLCYLFLAPENEKKEEFVARLNIYDSKLKPQGFDAMVVASLYEKYGNTDDALSLYQDIRANGGYWGPHALVREYCIQHSSEIENLDNLFVFDRFPPSMSGGAFNSYAKGKLESPYNILALYDDTYWDTGKKGYVVTSYGLLSSKEFYRCFLDDMYAEIKEVGLIESDYELSVGDDMVQRCGAKSDAAISVELLNELKNFYDEYGAICIK